MHVIFRLVVFHLPHASCAYKNFWLCDRCDKRFHAEKNQLPSMTSKRSHRLIKTSKVNDASIPTEIPFTKISKAYITHLMVD